MRKAIDGATKVFYKPIVADINAALAALDGLDKVADERFGRDAPASTDAQGARGRAASHVVDPRDKLAADPDQIEEIPPRSRRTRWARTRRRPAGRGKGGAPGALTQPTSVADAAARVAVSARYLRKQSPTSPGPYLMLRGLRWGELRGAMDGVPLDPKLLEAPATAVRAKLKGLLLDGNWTELLEQGEQLMATRAGARLARSATVHAHRVRSARLLVRRRGGGRTQRAARAARRASAAAGDDAHGRHADGEPGDREWLAAEGLAADGAADAAADGAAGAADDPRAAALVDALAQDDATSETGGLARARTAGAAAGGRRRGDGSLGTPDAFALARAELIQGRANRAIELLAGELARTRSPRGRFVRQTQIAYVMVEAGLDAVARPILEKLIADIDERKLEEWESGALVAQPMTLLCRVMDRAGESGKPRSDLYLRICRLDPMQALGLQPGSPMLERPSERPQRRTGAITGTLGRIPPAGARPGRARATATAGRASTPVRAPAAPRSSAWCSRRHRPPDGRRQPQSPRDPPTTPRIPRRRSATRCRPTSSGC